MHATRLINGERERRPIVHCARRWLTKSHRCEALVPMLSRYSCCPAIVETCISVALITIAGIDTVGQQRQRDRGDPKVRQLIRQGLDSLAYRLSRRLVERLPQTPPLPAINDLVEAANERQSKRIADEMRALIGDRYGSAAPVSASPAELNLAAALRGQFDHLLQVQGEDRHLTHAAFERALLLLGRSAALQVQQRETIAHLGDVEFRVTSQWGEDGIIEWLCHKLPQISPSFVEFGVEDFSEANTRFLLQNRGWTGIIIDADRQSMELLQHEAIYWKYDITAVHSFVTKDNINDLISSNGLRGEIGILSVDIDGNDYWVLDAINVVNPAIIICENNGAFGDRRPITIPYAESFFRFEAHYTGGYYGCSIKAVQDVCKRKGYTFLGTNTSGVNAFFVRDDLASQVVNSIREAKIWPHRHRGSRDLTGKLVFRRSREKLKLLEDLPVVDLESGRTLPIAKLLPLHSEGYW